MTVWWGADRIIPSIMSTIMPTARDIANKHRVWFNAQMVGKAAHLTDHSIESLQS